MSGRHGGEPVKTPNRFLPLAAGGLSIAAGVVLAPISLVELFRYSPYGDPGALGTGLWLGIAAVILIGVPVATGTLLFLRAMYRRYRAWKRTLTPAQRAWLAWGEFAAMEAAHLAMRDHNRKESARLTASVMGDERES